MAGLYTLKRMTVAQLAELILEESQHVLNPPQYINGKAKNLHRQSESDDSREVITHDRNFVDSLDLSPAKEEELDSDMYYDAMAEVNTQLESQVAVASCKPEAPDMVKDEKADIGQKQNKMLLRDISNPEELTRNLIEAILSITLSGKKVVLAFDNGIGALQDSSPLGVLRSLNNLKKDPKFEKLLKNLIIVETTPEKIHNKIERYLFEENTQVLIFARNGEREKLKKLESRNRLYTFYIDDTEFSPSSYYPLAEIVTIALCQYLDPRTMDNVSAMVEKLPIGAIENDMGVWIFKLLPNAEQYDRQELIKRYALLKRLLIAA